MAKKNDFIMTIEDDEDVESLDLLEDEKTDTDFKIDLDLDGLEAIPVTMDFSLARNNLAEKTGEQKKRSINDIILEKRRQVLNANKKLKSSSNKEEGKTNKDSNEEQNNLDVSDNQEENSDSDSDSSGSKSAKKSNKKKISTTRLKSKLHLKKKVEDSESEIDESEEARKREYFSQDKELDSIINSNEPSIFTSMNISRPIIRGLSSLGFVQPTPIQVKTIPIGLMGKDICGSAVTGSGKTAAFLVPVLERLMFRPTNVPLSRVLILTPTRELAMQCHNVASKIAAFTNIRISLAVGGLSIKSQENELRERPDIIIATPGRLIDHVRNSVSFTLDNIEILIMDEADRMLEDGFKDELTEIVQHCPKKRQTMLFSATMTDNINDLIRLSLNKPVRIMVDPPRQTATKLVQEFVRVRKGKEQSRSTFLVVLCKFLYKKRCIVFFRSKAEAHRFKVLFGLLGINAGELHGSMSQEARMLALEEFRDEKIDFLLATDLASRGLDIKGIETVINFNMPQTYDLYLHRVGRTARAGRSGRAVTLVGEEDRKILKMAIKAANKSGKSLVKQRVLDPAVCEKYKNKILSLKEAVDEVLETEKDEKKIVEAERDLTKAENLIKYNKEIHSRPKRTWFMSQKQKFDAKKKGNSE
ncbi:hypothetical protein BB560_000523 [Smittium megazygosporum]|uniref:RNA helicase n=1 Tax=Smittium megazygosporum TaxID=133381 RepID=A0A2T9ZKA7_9FUNG|nr:hypothetical protein BB560_000523 [Smittium megazygosporum]